MERQIDKKVTKNRWKNSDCIVVLSFIIIIFIGTSSRAQENEGQGETATARRSDIDDIRRALPTVRKRFQAYRGSPKTVSFVAMNAKDSIEILKALSLSSNVQGFWCNSADSVLVADYYDEDVILMHCGKPPICQQQLNCRASELLLSGKCPERLSYVSQVRQKSSKRPKRLKVKKLYQTIGAVFPKLQDFRRLKRLRRRRNRRARLLLRRRTRRSAADDEQIQQTKEVAPGLFYYHPNSFKPPKFLIKGLKKFRTGIEATVCQIICRNDPVTTSTVKPKLRKQRPIVLNEVPKSRSRSNPPMPIGIDSASPQVNRIESSPVQISKESPPVSDSFEFTPEEIAELVKTRNELNGVDPSLANTGEYRPPLWEQPTPPPTPRPTPKPTLFPPISPEQKKAILAPSEPAANPPPFIGTRPPPRPRKRAGYFGGALECFPSDATVSVKLQTDGSTVTINKRMDQLQIGDQTLTYSDRGLRYSPITWFHHSESKPNNATTAYVQIRTQSGQNLHISPYHLILIVPNCRQTYPQLTGSLYKSFKFAMRTRPGDCVLRYYYAPESEQPKLTETDPVLSVRMVPKSGAYAPITKEGTIVVDNIIASTYSSVEYQAVQYTLHSMLHTFWDCMELLRNCCGLWSIPELQAANTVPISARILMSIGQLIMT